MHLKQLEQTQQEPGFNDLQEDDLHFDEWLLIKLVPRQFSIRSRSDGRTFAHHETNHNVLDPARGEGEREAENRKQLHQKKGSLIVLSNAVVDNDAVMIHLADASFALRALGEAISLGQGSKEKEIQRIGERSQTVMSPGWTKKVADVAVGPADVPLVGLEKVSIKVVRSNKAGVRSPRRDKKVETETEQYVSYDRHCETGERESVPELQPPHKHHRRDPNVKLDQQHSPRTEPL